MRILFFVAALALFHPYAQAQCPASIVVSETNPCGLEPVTFSVNPVTPGYSYTWDFGDPESEDNNDTGINDNTFQGSTAVHAFTASNSQQTYTVTLYSQDENGEPCDTLTTSLNVLSAPSAILASNDFLICDTSVIGNGTSEVTIFFSGSTQMGVSYTIDWGDGSPLWSGTSAPTSLTHDYPAGLFYLTYTVEVEESDQFECNTSMATYLVYIGTNPDLGLVSQGENFTICLPDDINFVIQGTENNTPGTMYFVTINDGTDTITYSQQTLPDTINHVFEDISCGTTSGNLVDAYEFVIRAVNPCNVKEAAIRPIQVGRKPTAEMSIMPEPPKCDTTTFTFVNETDDGVFFKQQECDFEVKTEWIFTPLTPEAGPPNFILGNEISDSIIVNFQAGDYRVDMIVENEVV
ncbi:MAG: hypothetical protein NXI25_25450 [bacterium]|nr:hypothetical protein [bacterium]